MNPGDMDRDPTPKIGGSTKALEEYVRERIKEAHGQEGAGK